MGFYFAATWDSLDIVILGNALTGHLFKDMRATGTAGEEADSSPNMMWASRQLWKKYSVEHRHRVLSSVCTTIGYADTPWRPQFFDSITVESQRTTDDGPTVDPSHGLRHGCVRIGKPRETALLFSSRFLLVHQAAYTGLSSVVAVLEFRHDRQGSRDGDTVLR